jgi:hypothetical protein
MTINDLASFSYGSSTMRSKAEIPYGTGNDETLRRGPRGPAIPQTANFVFTCDFLTEFDVSLYCLGLITRCDLRLGPSYASLPNLPSLSGGIVRVTYGC